MPDVAFQHEPNRARGHALARLVDEERACVHVGRRPIFLDRLQRRQAHRADAFLAAFAKYAHRLRVGIHVGDVESG